MQMTADNLFLLYCENQSFENRNCEEYLKNKNNIPVYDDVDDEEVLEYGWTKNEDDAWICKSCTEKSKLKRKNY